ncbi:beta-phosphoglucomutase family hydrolase [Actinocorallia sp. B10E7]|uniref:HAD family hydrolase n=1 Tax=Actinocorallia sp. B10E7 TaxID=3153558 RepID=UPI00325F625F
MLGLPETTKACLFDLDGVLTDTAVLHTAAWKTMFDPFLASRGEAPFDPVKDYGQYVDGRKREDGVRTFLISRGIALPEGGPDDPPQAETVHGLAARKNTLLLELISERGVKVFPGSVEYVRAVRAAGMHTAVVSSSANTVQVLQAAGISGLFDARIDGVVARKRRLPGKPEPDTFLAGAAAVDVPAGFCAVFEDALAGVEAGRAGRFGTVVGVDRIQDGFHGPALKAHGADLVVNDLAELLERLWPFPTRWIPGRSGRPRWTSTGSRRPSPSSPFPTGTSGCAAIWTRGSRTGCPAPI